MNSPLCDATATLQDLKRLVQQFVDQRDWRQFHTPKNLSMALAIEAAELMEHFQWLTAEQSLAIGQRSAGPNSEKLAAVGEELADVLCYALALGNALNLDLAAAVAAKMKKNEQKYPSDQFRGRYGVDDPGPGSSTAR